jgi:hypothetical protein
MRATDAKIFNLSLGHVLHQGIEFSWVSPELSELTGRAIEFYGEIVNNPELFDAENQLAAHHSMENKQNLGHNPRASTQTAILHLRYGDFHPDHTYAYVENANGFIQYVVAPILSFFQRRRVLISTARLMSSQKWVYAMPPFLAAEWLDSVAFGPEAIATPSLATSLVTALSTYERAQPVVQGRIKMLLQRYNELLNLPYVHERAEGLWRIIEALGSRVDITDRSRDEYRRLLRIIGIRASSNLALLLHTLSHYEISYTDTEVIESRQFRNHATHEYLDPLLLNWETLPACFGFLQRCADQAILGELGIGRSELRAALFQIIQNRVL